MKKTAITLMLATVLLAACNHNEEPANAPVDDYRNNPQQSSADSLTRSVQDEMHKYRVMIEQRLAEMRDDIEKKREKRAKEVNKKAQKDYDAAIAKAEEARKKLEAKLDTLGNTMDSGWQKMKQDLDDFFSRKDSIY